MLMNSGQNASPSNKQDLAVPQHEMETPSTFLVTDSKYLAAELNPFEQSFATDPSTSQGNNASNTAKPSLPGVLEMFTPGGTNQYEQFPFGESLRNGPLSPNLLTGPQGPLPFDPSTFRIGLTPNESHIRTGLTPGNPSGYPLLPTPGTAALLGGPYTPNTTAALASIQSSTFAPVPEFNHAPPRTIDQFGENQAANGLVFLAQTSQQQAQMPNTGTREELVKQAGVNASSSKPNAYAADVSSQAPSKSTKAEEAPKATPNIGTRGKNKKDEGKETGGKKMKSKSQETDDDKRRNFLERNRQGSYHRGPRFCIGLCELFYLLRLLLTTLLAALKCRQRKKQWLTSLQQKVDWYTRENELLSTEVGDLRQQVTTLKTLLAAHKDCSLAQQNGATADAIAQAVGQSGVFPVHPYR
jgi:ATF/CREB family transcription factor